MLALRPKNASRPPGFFVATSRLSSDFVDTSGSDLAADSTPHPSDVGSTCLFTLSSQDDEPRVACSIPKGLTRATLECFVSRRAFPRALLVSDREKGGIRSSGRSGRKVSIMSYLKDMGLQRCSILKQEKT